MALLAPPMPPPPPPPAPDRERVSRTVLVIAAAAALIVVVMIAVALITQDPADAGDDETAAAGEVAAQAEVEVPGTAPDGKDSAGEDVSYTAGHLVDGDPSTAWRVEGDAEGEEIVLTLPETRTVTEVGIVNGYAKVDDDSGDRRYGQNRRVLAATWIFDDGTEASFELEETVEPQAFTLESPVETTTVRVRLDEVSDPGGRDFTAISELSLLGR
ncbi:discoidin domain-containing protein [Jiangella endophytica]|uniref:discoidin domain-containing protein n=1 Tax=Jiangella endophytica TaxID=1623398 RepID=UPI0018E50F91|nr:discoidin domain-containing protein [Jiangella endophytica]